MTWLALDVQKFKMIFTSCYISKWDLDSLNMPEYLLVCIYYDLISSEMFKSLK